MTTQITYRRTRQGEWVAYGPAEAVAADTVVTISRKDGTTSRRYVKSAGRIFIVDGAEMVYGYLAEGEMPEKTFEEAVADEQARRDAAAQQDDVEITAEDVAAEAAECAAAPVQTARPYAARYRARPTGGCKRCGGHLDDYDRDVAAIPGYHADCL